jgi:hypothetical protein
MQSDNAKEQSAARRAEMRKLLGRPPVLSTEAAERFEAIFEALVECINPRDMLEFMAVWEHTVAFWESDRYVRCRALRIEHRFRRSMQVLAAVLKSQKTRQQPLANSHARILPQAPTDIAQVAGQEITAANVVDEFDEILRRTPTEFDHAEVLDNSIGVEKDFELLIVSAAKRKNEALRMLDWYRAGLGKEVEDTMKDIIDADYQEVIAAEAQAIASPPLAPADDEATKGEVES